MDEIKSDIYNILESAIGAAIETGELPISEVPEIPFSPTKTPEHGDIATPIALSLAKQVKMAPRAVAETIIKHVNQNEHPSIRKIEIAGPGFINVYLSDEWLLNTIREIITKKGQLR